MATFRNITFFTVLCLTFSNSINAANIFVVNGNFGDWDTQVFVGLGPASAYTETGNYNPDQTTVSRTPITGYLKLFLNSSYSGNASVGIDLSLADIGGSTFDDSYSGGLINPNPNFYTMTLNNPMSTNTLSVHIMDYYTSESCYTDPTNPYCLNFDYGNASITPFPNFGSPESGYDLALDLGAISFVDQGNGTTNLSIGNDLSDITLRFLSDDGDLIRKDFVFTSSAVPVPAAMWLFGSGLLGLIGVARRKKE